MAVPRHANQMRALQVQQESQNSEMANAARLTKSEVHSFYLYFMFLVCYLLNAWFYYAIPNSGWSTNVKIFAATLVFLNSLLNSLIYCWKMRPQVAQAQNENTIELYDLPYKTLYGKFTLVFKMLKQSYECGNKTSLTLTWVCLCVLCVIWAQFMAVLGEVLVRCCSRCCFST